jgi:Rps23 Pro-64 3,4-dihydroxylase Tpa1-like proline 4-hydroxylase
LQVALETVVLEEFLAPTELASVMQFTLDNESRFTPSVVLGAGDTQGRVDAAQRRSQVLDQPGPLEQLFRERIERALPAVLQRLGLPAATPERIDVQITATNDGGFFRAHIDNSTERFRSRKVSFVYFFEKEPTPFTGGELRIFDLRSFDEQARRGARYTEIQPAQNQIVFFPSSYLHEIALVECPSGAFADSRFTVNGWIHWQ